MSYKAYIPSKELIPYIDRYWYYHNDENTDLFPIIAGTGVDLIIHFGTPFISDKGGLTSSHIICPRRFLTISSGGNLNLLAIRFRSGAFRHFCNINFNELNNNFLSFADIWGKEGENVEERLHGTGISICDKISILNLFLIKQLTINRKDDLILDKTIAYIYRNYEECEILTIANQLNISLRHFERLFKNEFGVSPKKFQVISRFQSTLKQLLFSSDADYLPIALDSGYYDQSHFIRECKLLSGLSPLEIISTRDKKAHFYFKRISVS